MDSVDVQGKFWPAGKPERKVFGHLQFQTTKNGLAELGVMADHAENGDVFGDDASRIIGDAKGGPYTLDRCFRRRHSASSSGMVEETHHVGIVLAGAEFDKDEPLVFESVAVRLRGLIWWVGGYRLEHSVEDEEGKPGRFSIVSERVAPPSCRIPSGGELNLDQVRAFAGDGVATSSITQDLRFRIIFHDRLTLSEALGITSDLQDLVTIATTTTASYDEVKLYHHDLCRSNSSGERLYSPIRFLAPWHAQPDTGAKPQHTSKMAFTYNDLGGIDGIAGWLLASEKYRQQLGRVMNSVYAWMFLEDRFMHRIAALEAMHGEWTGTQNKREVALLARLLEMAALAGPPFAKLVGDTGRWCTNAKDERNNIAHQKGRSVYQDSSHLELNCRIAYWLFVLSLLRLAKAPDAVFTRIASCREFQWIRERMEATSHGAAP